MKTRFTLFALLTLILTGGLYAQSRVVQKENAPFARVSEHATNQHARAVESVLFPSFDDDCSLTVTSFGFTDDWGGIAGSNYATDLEFAQQMTFSGSATYTVLGIVASFAQGSVVGDGEIRAKIYSYDANIAGPAALLGTSDSTLVSDVSLSDTAAELTGFLFLEGQVPMLEDSMFYVSIDISALYETDDTVALWHTMDECGDGLDSWVLWADGDWVDIFETYDINIDFFMGAIVEFDEATSADEYVKYNGLELYPAAPSPARHFTNLNYGLDKVDKVNIDVFDAQGKRIKSIERQGQSTGIHQEQILTHNMSPGTYFYRISNSAGSLVSRFMVQ